MLSPSPLTGSWPAAGRLAGRRPSPLAGSPAATFFERAVATELSLVGQRQAAPREDGESGWHVAGSETLGMIAAQQHTTVASLIALNRHAYPALVGHRFAGVRGMVLRVR